MTRRLLLLGAIAALVASPPAAGNGDGRARGYTSTVAAVRPASAGIELSVLLGDDRLLLRNESGETVVIFGYEGEPYLRFEADGVWRNARSPATYLNEDRYAQVRLPAEADAEAEPRWEKVAARPVWDWHDHRIHWMSTIDPPRVRTAPEEEHHVFDWEVPGTVGGEPLVIAGSLDYAPPDTGAPRWPFLVAPLAGLGVAGVLMGIFRRKRRVGA